MSRSADAPRPRVAVVFGGRSTEHGISCVTASGVLAAIDRSRYDVVAIGVTRAGAWLLVDDDPAPWALRGHELPEVTTASAALPGRVLTRTDSVETGLVRVLEGQAPVPLGPVDVVLPLLHGPYGEDGTLQGLLELSGTRYVGSGVLASAACMDKHTMKVLLRHEGFAVADWELVQPARWRADLAGVVADVARLGAPVFVKPSRAGSSFGITRLDDPSDPDALLAALEAAAEHDPRVLVEQAAVGREVECGVIGSADGGPPEPSVCGEVVVLTDGFYDFAAKYLEPDAVRLDTPADLPTSVAEKVRAESVRAFQVLGCEGLARVDWFVDLGDGSGDGSDGGSGNGSGNGSDEGTGPRLVVNELNTMPGFTATSMYPRLWAESGVAYPELVDRLLRLALGRTTGLR